MGELEKLKYCLALSRDARALVLRDAESFHEASTALEHIGQVLYGEVLSGLWHYREKLISRAVESLDIDNEQASRLFKVIQNARNSAVHDGAWARHLSIKLIEFVTALEKGAVQAIKTQKENMNDMLRVEDIMVRSPVVAETWQMVAHVRREMLTNSFSNLPVFWNGAWHLITDGALMQFLRSTVNHDDYKARLNKPLQEVLTNEPQTDKVHVSEAVFCSDINTVTEAVQMIQSHPVLLVCHKGDKSRLVGILSAFDLL